MCPIECTSLGACLIAPGLQHTFPSHTCCLRHPLAPGLCVLLFPSKLLDKLLLVVCRHSPACSSSRVQEAPPDQCVRCMGDSAQQPSLSGQLSSIKQALTVAACHKAKEPLVAGHRRKTLLANDDQPAAPVWSACQHIWCCTPHQQHCRCTCFLTHAGSSLLHVQTWRVHRLPCLSE